jgi:hypothetical protein
MNRVVVPTPTRQATQAGGTDSLESVLGLLKGTVQRDGSGRK